MKIAYFLGNFPSHYVHAKTLHEALGGDVIVISNAAQKALSGQSVESVCVEDLPESNLEIPKTAKRTYNSLQKYDLVFFFDSWYFKGISKKQNQFLSIQLFHGVSNKSYIRFGSKRHLILLSRFDYLAGLGPTFYKTLQRHGVQANRILPVGSPRTDELLIGDEFFSQRNILKSYGLDPSRKTILYMPTYWGPTSAHCLGPKIISSISEIVNLIIRPHPQTPESLLAPMRSQANSRLYTLLLDSEKNYGIFSLQMNLRACDAVIGDTSSAFFEAILLEKPMIFAYDPCRRYRQSNKYYKGLEPLLKSSLRITEQNLQLLSEDISSVFSDQPDKAIYDQVISSTYFSKPGHATSDLIDVLKQLPITHSKPNFTTFIYFVIGSSLLPFRLLGSWALNKIKDFA